MKKIALVLIGVTGLILGGCSNWDKAEKSSLDFHTKSMSISIPKFKNTEYQNCYKNYIIDNYSYSDFMSTSKRPLVMQKAISHCVR